MSAPTWMENFSKDSQASPPSGDAGSATPTPTPNSGAPAGDPVSLKAPEAKAPPLGDALNTNTPPADGQPTGDAKQANAGDPAKDGAKPDDAAYQAFNLPDGLAISPEHQQALTEYGKQYNLPQDAVQRVVDLGVEVATQTRLAIEQEAAAEAKAVRDEWKQALLSDPELGGPKLKQTQDNLNAFQQSKLADPALIQLLNETGLLLNPHVARLLSRVGASLREAPITFGGGDTPGQTRSPAHELYSKSQHN